MSHQKKSNKKTDFRGYSAIGLDNCKNKINLGAVLRASKCYQAGLVAISGNRIPKKKFWGRADTEKAFRHLPLLWTENLKEAADE